MVLHKCVGYGLGVTFPRQKLVIVFSLYLSLLLLWLPSALPSSSSLWWSKILGVRISNSQIYGAGLTFCHAWIQINFTQPTSRQSVVTLYLVFQNLGLLPLDFFHINFTSPFQDEVMSLCIWYFRIWVFLVFWCLIEFDWVRMNFFWRFSQGGKGHFQS